MADCFTGEIRIFGFSFAPVQWAFCDGSLMAIQQNTALFSLLGTNYGGNGQSTFQLPNFIGRAATNQGSGPGLTPRDVGETFGENSLTLLSTEMPQHTHSLEVYNQSKEGTLSGSPSAGNWLTSPTRSSAFGGGNTTNSGFSPNMIGLTGGGQPHENRSPFLAMNFCISLAGYYPSFG